MRLTIKRLLASICLLTFTVGLPAALLAPASAQGGTYLAAKPAGKTAGGGKAGAAADAGSSQGAADAGKKGADKPLSVKLISVTSPVHAGDDVTINVQTAPRSKCDIAVKLKSGLSKAKGLEAKDANNTGKVSWTWKVAKNTAAGPMTVTVNCAWGEKKGSLETTVDVQK